MTTIEQPRILTILETTLKVDGGIIKLKRRRLVGGWSGQFFPEGDPYTTYSCPLPRKATTAEVVEALAAMLTTGTPGQSLR